MAVGEWRGGVRGSGGVDGPGRVGPAAASAPADRVRGQHEQHCYRSTGTIDFTIDRWSTDAERDKLLSTFLEKGPEKLLDAVQDAKPTGRILAPDKVGWDIRYARYRPLPDGGRDLLLTDRLSPFGRRAIARGGRLSVHGDRDEPTRKARAKGNCRLRPRSTSTGKKVRARDLRQRADPPEERQNRETLVRGHGQVVAIRAAPPLVAKLRSVLDAGRHDLEDLRRQRRSAPARS